MHEFDMCRMNECEYTSGAGGVQQQVHVGRKREVHTTSSRGYSNDYIHAETMYNLTAMTNRKMKFGALVWGGVFAGTVIPLIAVSFQQAKARGG